MHSLALTYNRSALNQRPRSQTHRKKTHTKHGFSAILVPSIHHLVPCTTFRSSTSPLNPLTSAGVNLITAAFIAECSSILASLASVPPRAFVLCSAKAGSFCHGADVRALQALATAVSNADLRAKVEAFKAVVDAIEALPCPTTAVLHGVALGGGLELALACDYRLAVADDAAGQRARLSVGMPEIKLGVVAGGGGCVRLPRLLGLAQALPLMLSGDAFGLAKAEKVGLLQRVLQVDSGGAAGVHFTAGQAPAWAPALEALWAQGAVSTKPTRRYPRHLAGNTWVEQQLIYTVAKGEVDKKTEGHFPALYACLDTVLRAWNQPVAEAMQTETAAFVNMARTPEAASLMSLFLVQSDIRKRAWQPVVDGLGAHAAAAPGKVPLAVLVLGAGQMGAGLGQHLAARGATVVLYDIKAAQLKSAERRVRTLFDDLVRAEKMTKAEAQRRAATVSYTSTLDAASFEQQALKEGQQPVVLEAVFEDLQLKQKLVAEVRFYTEAVGGWRLAIGGDCLSSHPFCGLFFPCLPCLF